MSYALTVSYKGQLIRLNPIMLIQQNIIYDDEKINLLLYYHFHRLVELDLMRKCDVKDTVRLRFHVSKLTCIDYKLQKIWGFNVDKKYHRFWEHPHCICPNGEDNLEMSGWIINTKCPAHGYK